MGGALAGHFSAQANSSESESFYSYDASAHFIVPYYCVPATPVIIFMYLPSLLLNLEHLSFITSVFDAAVVPLHIDFLQFDVTRRKPPRIKIRTAVSPFRVIEPGSTRSNNYNARILNSRRCDISTTSENRKARAKERGRDRFRASKRERNSSTTE